ncbi:MAG: hypothetical protein QOG46_2776 [Pseudonocardiales bacterium]|jgi:hypothetical protein|nr:hypothetical protein [Pseudonocardiales bacterium]
MTLLQLTALHLISAQAPVALTDVAQAPVLPGVGWFADRNQWHGRRT